MLVCVSVLVCVCVCVCLWCLIADVTALKSVWEVPRVPRQGNEISVTIHHEILPLVEVVSDQQYVSQ